MKNQVKTGRYPENFNTDPSPVRNMHFEGPRNMNQMRSPFMEKGEVYSSFLQKELNTSVILIILIIIIAPRQLGNHPMQLGLHNSAFKNSNLSIYGYISTIEGDIRGVFNNASAQSTIECFLSERRRLPRCLQ